MQIEANFEEFSVALDIISDRKQHLKLFVASDSAKVVSWITVIR